MTDSIVCPHCNKSIQINEALTHQIDEKYQKMIEEERKKAEEERAKLINFSKKRIEEERQKATKEAEESLRKKVKEEMETRIKNTENESEELRKEKKQMQEQFLELNKTIRELKNQNEKKELELTKKFNEEQEKVKQQEQKKMEEKFKLELLEKEKKLQDVIKSNEDLKRKLEQGSQQMQGEVLELAIEDLLQKEFPQDEIKPVPKGITGADIIQVVKTQYGRKAGKLIWEMKRTKTWSNQWIEKLKDDQRQVGADIAVIISQAVPDSINKFGFQDGIWICEFDTIVGVAYALRSQLLELSSVRSSLDGQNDKMNLLYNYVTSTEFKHRVEAIIEAFTNMQNEIEKERRWFSLKWAREEKNLRKVLDNTIGMQGDLQSIMGNSMGSLKGLDELPSEVEQTDDEESTLF